MADKKVMASKDFQTLGFIQEINRRLLHPCGLSLELGTGATLGEEVLIVVDYRDKPEGCYFLDQDLSRPKAQIVIDLFQSKLRSRREVFGHIIQPVPDYIDDEDLNGTL